MRGGRIRRLIEQNPARSTEIPSASLFPLPYACTHPYYPPAFVQNLQALASVTDRLHTDKAFEPYR